MDEWANRRMGESRMGAGGQAGSLARIDLAQLRIDSESFLGQAVDLGVRFRKLPEQIADTLLAYLRMTATSYAQRNRTGIAVSREGLEAGVRQALVCVELGLRDASEEDLNRAVDLLSGGVFEGFRKRGWEMAFFRLEEMRDTSRRLLKRPEAHFLKPFLRDIQRWSRLVGGTWSIPPGDDDNEEVQVHPIRDYATFQDVSARLDFLRPLPEQAFRDLLAASEDGGSFGNLVRNLVLCLFLDLTSLLPNHRQVGDFRRRCFDGGKMRPEAREKVMFLVERQLNAQVEAAYRDAIRQEVEEEIALLEQASGQAMDGLFIARNSP